VIEVDLLGVVRTIKPALSEIIRNRGYVLVTASIYAFFNGVLNSGYAACKSGVESLGRALRLELAADGASAGVLYPGWVTTPLTTLVRGEDETATRLRDRVFRGPFGSFIPPEQVARAVVAGMEARAPRIIEPRIWAPASLLRGALNALGDRLAERDQEVLRLIRQADSQERERLSGSEGGRNAMDAEDSTA
jgi:NAD(P)-dependent dehydrogenase (short-subunit alcohol dehydrogenase family)